VLCLVLLSALVFPTPSLFVKAQAAGVSSVFVNPVSTCCSGTVPLVPGDTISLGIMMNLTGDQAISGFDIRLNYTNPASGSTIGTMQAGSISYASNVFAGMSGTVLANCVDGIGYISGGNGCAPDDNQAPGQIHFAEALVGQTLRGPQSKALLFSISFSVARNGTSLVYFDRANLVNPNPDPSNPQIINPVYVPLLTYSGIFGNNGVVAFFNFKPSDPTLSVAILPNQPAIFDATGSVDSYDNSLIMTKYSWNFGDGPSLQNTTIPVIQHPFAFPGNYSVQMTASDSSGRTGSITRIVPVVPALGTLALTVKDQMGSVLRGNVLVSIFNSSLSRLPFVSKTIDLGGQVQFKNLVPGRYYVTFSGQGIVTSSKNEQITPGWTQLDTVYLSLIVPPPDYGWLFFVVPIIGGLGVVTTLALRNRKNSSKNNRSGKPVGTRPKKSSK